MGVRVEGRVRTTVIDPAGQAETNDFEPGDIWYFPRGHAHVLECLGNEPTHFILIFDNGYFSEFGTFSITDWIGHAPQSLLAKNFGLPESTFDGFPSKEVYFARGAIPPEQSRKSARCASCSAADAQIPHAGRSAARRLQRRPRMARRFHALSDFDDDDRRGSRPRTRRAPRTALASDATNGSTSSRAR